MTPEAGLGWPVGWETGCLERRALILIVFGAAAGVFAGLGYLSGDGRCTVAVENYGACRINHAWIPFLGTVLAGVLVAFALYALIGRLWTRSDDDSLTGSASEVRRTALEPELEAIAMGGPSSALQPSGVEESKREARVRIGERGRPVPRPRGS